MQTVDKESETAQVFMIAFKAMSENDRSDFLAMLAKERELLEDLYDMALIEQRKDEPERPFREFLKEKGLG